jgi:phospholipase/carboxylesterase
LSLGPAGLQQDRDHLRESEQAVARLVQSEIGRGISAARIVLAGFSQGGAVVLGAGLHHTVPVAGILALSAPVPNASELMTEVHTANAATPIMLAHGRSVPVVPFAMGEMLRDRALERGLRVEWHEYNMAHSVCAEEIDDIATWLGRVLDG